jgi:hypothetical protein
MLRYALVAAAAALVLTTPAAADHVVTNAATPTGYPADEPAASSGDWKFLGNFSMGPAAMQELGTDVELFTRDGKTHAIVGSMTLGFRLFRYDDVSAAPAALGDYASAFPCTLFGPATIIQNKVENDRDVSDTASIAGWQNDVAVSGDGMIAGIATDADGRCHDSAGGGVELADISNLARPHLFHLTRHFGESHTLTIDDQRGLVYVSSSDTQLNAIDIVDFRSCVPPATDLTRFLACRPVVARYQFPVAHGANVPGQFKDPRYPDGLTAGTADKGNNGCHDITVQGNFLYCAAINATVIFDISGLIQNGVLTGTHLTDAVMVAAHKDPTAVGVPTHCPVRDGTPGMGRPASVTDCEVWGRPTSGDQNSRYAGDDFMRANLRNAGMFPLAVISHGGTTTTKPPTEDVSISHESDPTEDGTILMITDERGGGLTNACGPGSRGGGGAWFYDIRDKANPKLLKQPDGSNAVFISDRVPMAGNCTIHVIQQIPGRSVIVAAWYIEGTHVFSFAPDLDAGTVSFNELGHYIPAGTAPETWTSYPIGVDDGRLTIQTGDMTRGSDILSFLLDPPGTTTAPSGGGQPQPGGPQPQPQPGAQQPTPPTEGGVAGAEAERTSHMVRGKGALKRVRFAIDLRKAAGTKVTFVSRTLRFAVTRITTLRFAGAKATLAGVGRVNGKRVRYTLVVLDRGVGRRDSVTLRLSNGVRIQGRLVAGNVTVR